MTSVFRLCLPLALAAFACASALERSDRPARPEIGAGSVFLGQAYPSGRVYLERFLDEERMPVSGDWPEHVLIFPLDDIEHSELGLDSVPTMAQFIRTEEGWVNPPAVEGMLEPDSPCAPDGYEPAASARYADPTGAERDSWNEGEYYATDEWFGCAAETSLPVYRMTREPAASFRVLAFAADVVVDDVIRERAGDPRPMAPADRAALRRLQEIADECTLRPRSVDEATELLRFRLQGIPGEFRVARHVEACTSLAEHFLLDVLGEQGIRITFRTIRWRGNP